MGSQKGNVTHQLALLKGAAEGGVKEVRELRHINRDINTSNLSLAGTLQSLRTAQRSRENTSRIRAGIHWSFAQGCWGWNIARSVRTGHTLLRGQSSVDKREYRPMFNGIIWQGRGVPQNDVRAFELFKTAADKGKYGTAWLGRYWCVLTCLIRTGLCATQLIAAVPGRTGLWTELQTRLSIRHVGLGSGIHSCNCTSDIRYMSMYTNIRYCR